VSGVKKIGNHEPVLLTEEEEWIWTIVVYAIGMIVGLGIAGFLK